MKTLSLTKQKSGKKVQESLKNQKVLHSRSSSLKKIRRYTKKGVRSLLLSHIFSTACKALAVLFIAVGVLYGAYFFLGKAFNNDVVVSQSEIIARVSRLTSLPSNPPYDLVRVQNEEALKKENDFYKDVKEGDYILMYKNLAVIYDLRANTIVAIKQTGALQ